MTIRSTRLQNLRGAGSWYTVKNQETGPTQIHIYDEIGYVGVSAQQFLGDLAKIQGAIELHLSTPGGEVFDGIAIYNALKQRGDVTVIVDSLAASIGSVIAQAGNPTIMSKNSTMMIHDGFGMTVGNAADMRQMADVLDKTSDNIASIYAERTKTPVAHWRELMKNETWFTAEEAVQAGLADYVQGGDKNSLTWDLSFYQNAAGKKKKPVFDPDHDGDDDSTAEGDTDHDYVLPDGSPGPKSGKKNKKAAKALADSGYLAAEALITIFGDNVDNSPWDAAKAWHNGTTADDPAKFYKAICAGEKNTGDPATQAHWALPYRYTPTSPPNAGGVRNALARLDQTQDLKNKQAAQDLLERLMKQVNPDYEPANNMTVFIRSMRDSLKGRHDGA